MRFFLIYQEDAINDQDETWLIQCGKIRSDEFLWKVLLQDKKIICAFNNTIDESRSHDVVTSCGCMSCFCHNKFWTFTDLVMIKS